MEQAQISSIERTGEHRVFAAHGHADLATAGGLTLLRGVFEPDWRWSRDVKPIAGTDSCQVRHLGYMISGSMQNGNAHIFRRAGEEFAERLDQSIIDRISLVGTVDQDRGNTVLDLDRQISQYLNHHLSSSVRIHTVQWAPSVRTYAR